MDVGLQLGGRTKREDELITVVSRRVREDVDAELRTEMHGHKHGDN